MKLVNLVIILTALVPFLCGCNPVVDRLAFQPDSVNVLDENQLPKGIKEISLLTEDEVKIKLLYLPVASSNKILLYFHGNAGNIYHRIPTLIQLQKFGVNVIGVSYRGYGKSEGSPSEDGVYLDGMAALKYITETLGFSEKNIIIFGRSIGTTVAINTAENRELGGVVLVTPLTSVTTHSN